jgi:ubiquinol-cytochrome c reductase iron-sulfur subunit
MTEQHTPDHTCSSTVRDESSESRSNPSNVDVETGPGDKYNRNRRHFLAVVATTAAAVGAALAGLPFVRSLLPSEKARAVGGPVTVDIAALEPGNMLSVIWRGQPIWVVKRTAESLRRLQTHDDQLRDPSSLEAQQPDYAQNPTRSIRPDLLVAVGVCTHLGCVPIYRPDVQYGETRVEGWSGGFYCPCHGSRFDLAGRVYRGVPAPLNLRVPPYQYLSDTKILIGTNEPGA